MAPVNQAIGVVAELDSKLLSCDRRSHVAAQKRPRQDLEEIRAIHLSAGQSLFNDL
jgi:hypothetical protein